MITPDGIRRMIDNAVGPLRARARGLVRRALLSALDNSAGMASGSFSLTDHDVDVMDGVELLHPIGVSSRPARGTEAIVLAVGGNASNRVAIPFVRGQRLAGDDIADDEVALYIGATGQVVHLKADGSVVVSAAEVGGGAGGAVVLKANGDVVVTPSATGKVFLGEDGALKKVALADDVDARLSALQTAHDTHVHPGVTAGPGSTGVTPALVGPLAPTGAANVYGKG